MHTDFLRAFASTADLTDKNQIVVVGTVESERRGEPQPPADDPLTPRILSIAVERTLVGTIEKRFELPTLGWVQRGGKDVRVVNPEVPVLNERDRVLLVLHDDGRGGYDIVNPESIYHLRDGQIVDTERESAVAQELEAMSEKGALELLAR